MCCLLVLLFVVVACCLVLPLVDVRVSLLLVFVWYRYKCGVGVVVCGLLGCMLLHVVVATWCLLIVGRRLLRLCAALLLLYGGVFFSYSLVCVCECFVRGRCSFVAFVRSLFAVCCYQCWLWFVVVCRCAVVGVGYGLLLFLVVVLVFVVVVRCVLALFIAVVCCC